MQLNKLELKKKVQQTSGNMKKNLIIITKGRLGNCNLESYYKRGVIIEEERLITQFNNKQMTEKIDLKEQENLLISLSDHGYEFNNDHELFTFIRKNVTLKYAIGKKTFLLNDEPILSIHYNTIPEGLIDIFGQTQYVFFEFYK